MKQTKIKICGITRKDQAIEIAEMGIDALGFVMYPPSPRYIPTVELKTILSVLPPYTTTVGVFVNDPLDQVYQTMKSTGLHLAQLHGEESPQYCKELTSRGINWLKAFRIKDHIDNETIKSYSSRYIHLDAWSEEVYGGTGETFAWELAKQLSQEHSLILSGGINEVNAREAINQLHPYAIDLSSSVESSPGIKSIERIRALLMAVRP
ncbi:MAG: phosphoribosylanthranilate isomerase [Deltaproteobacteria bacterium]|nr:phosphoribosylanthranilate isomerase [Deltaproteobacteria bacterium]